MSLLTALGEALSPMFVCKCMQKVMDKIKAPIAHQVYLDWMKEAIKEFGVNAFSIQTISVFCTQEMDSRDVKVRTSAVAVLGALYHQVGPRLQSIVFSDDMKPALKSMIEAEFSKVNYLNDYSKNFYVFY